MFDNFLTGFVDLGDIDNRLCEYERVLSDDQQKPQVLAKTMAVFMERGALTGLVLFLL